MSEDEVQKLTDELKKLKADVRADRKLIQEAADALAEIGRGPGLIDRHADVLVALRLRIEGKPRAKLEDLLTAAGDIGGKKDLGDVLAGADEPSKSEWPEVKDKKRDWPAL